MPVISVDVEDGVVGLMMHTHVASDLSVLSPDNKKGVRLETGLLNEWLKDRVGD